MNQKKFKMIYLWLLLALMGAALSIFAGYKISEEGTKETNQKIKNLNHPIPEFLYFDLIIYLNVDRTFQNILSKEILTIINIPNGNNKELKEIPLNIFFDEINFEENTIANKNFNIKSDYFKNLKEFDFFAYTSTQANDTTLKLNLSKDAIMKFTETNKIDSFSNIKIESYNKSENLIKVIFQNIKLSVASNSTSGSLRDIENSSFIGSLILPKPFKISKIQNFTLKTKKTKYFVLSDLLIEDFKITGKLEKTNLVNWN